MGAPRVKLMCITVQLALAGLELGNASSMLQPARGYGMDPDAIYHSRLAADASLLALYRWLKDEWQADASCML